jgi:hypothetical protein
MCNTQHTVSTELPVNMAEILSEKTGRLTIIPVKGDAIL